MEWTAGAVKHQIAAMGAEVFEVGLFKPRVDPNSREPEMLPRTWNIRTLLNSLSWLQFQNLNGRNIYIRPKGENNLSLIDDLTAAGVSEMKKSGFQPAVLTETSPGNFQVWLKHAEMLPKDLGTAAARALAAKFQGDRGAADWRHFGRLAGFTNRKDKHRQPSGLYPFVRLAEATGEVYDEARQFIEKVKTDLETERAARARRVYSPKRIESSSLKSINSFRSNPVYGGDWTRVDLAYAIYALSRGVPESEVEAVIGSRDLSHKGDEKRQVQYVERTLRKAGALIAERSNMGRER
jgi:DNA primase RepB-like protein